MHRLCEDWRGRPASRDDRITAETAFSGAVRVDRDGEIELLAAYGDAHRGWAIPNTPETRFAIASGGKGLTALAVASLIEDGTLDWSTTARSLLGDDLRLIGDTVTVKQLMAHRSGIGDYLDEDAGATSRSVRRSRARASRRAVLAVLDGTHRRSRPMTLRY